MKKFPLAIPVIPASQVVFSHTIIIDCVPLNGNWLNCYTGGLVLALNNEDGRLVIGGKWSVY